MRSTARIALAAVACGAASMPVTAAIAAPALKIEGEKHVSVGQSTELTILGRSHRRRGLAIYLDDAHCARGVAAEEARRLPRRLVLKPVAGKFKHTVTFLRSSGGSHYICAYLYHGAGSSFVTDRHAAFHYVTR